ncbi:MAG: hypothetical protein ABT940_03445 [Alphaproteobacteria bacterium]
MPKGSEAEFRAWYSGHAKKLGLSQNPDDPLHYYDYRAAWAAGAAPDTSGHWPSEFKLAGHPNLIVAGVDTRTGVPVSQQVDASGRSVLTAADLPVLEARLEKLKQLKALQEEYAGLERQLKERDLAVAEGQLTRLQGIKGVAESKGPWAGSFARWPQVIEDVKGWIEAPGARPGRGVVTPVVGPGGLTVGVVRLPSMEDALGFAENAARTTAGALLYPFQAAERLGDRLASTPADLTDMLGQINEWTTQESVGFVDFMTRQIHDLVLATHPGMWGMAIAGDEWAKKELEKAQLEIWNSGGLGPLLAVLAAKGGARAAVGLPKRVRAAMGRAEVNLRATLPEITSSVYRPMDLAAWRSIESIPQEALPPKPVGAAPTPKPKLMERLGTATRIDMLDWAHRVNPSIPTARLAAMTLDELRFVISEGRTGTRPKTPLPAPSAASEVTQISDINSRKIEQLKVVLENLHRKYAGARVQGKTYKAGLSPEEYARKVDEILLRIKALEEAPPPSEPIRTVDLRQMPERLAEVVRRSTVLPEQLQLEYQPQAISGRQLPGGEPIVGGREQGTRLRTVTRGPRKGETVFETVGVSKGAIELRPQEPGVDAMRRAAQATNVQNAIDLNKQELKSEGEVVTLGAGLGPTKVTVSPTYRPGQGQAGTAFGKVWNDLSDIEKRAIHPGLKEALKDRFQLFWRLKESPNRVFFADAREWLRQVMSAPRIGKEQAFEALQSIIGRDISHDQYDIVSQRIFAEDLAESAVRGETLPFNLTAANIAEALPGLVRRVDADPVMRGMYARHRRVMDAIKQDLIARGKLDPETARQFYIHHDVIDFLQKRGTGIGGPGLKAAIRKYTKKRHGSLRAINMDYLDVQYRSMSRIFTDNVIDDHLGRILMEYERRVVDGEYTGPISEFIPSRYGIAFFAKTPTDMAILPNIEAAVEAFAEGTGMDPVVVRRALFSAQEGALYGGRGSRGFKVPAELAYVLENFRQQNIYMPEHIVVPKWKAFVLNKNPIRYNRRNLIGDFERAVNAIPGLMSPAGRKALGDAWHDVWADIYNKQQRRPEEFKSFQDRDVVSGGEIAYEVGGVKKLPTFAQWDTRGTIRKKLSWANKELREYTVARENWLRLAVAYYNMDRVRAGKSIASGISDIGGISNPMDAVAKVARENLGDYGAFTAWEQRHLRNRLAPFYSWLKINTTFWPLLAKRQGLGAAVKGGGLTGNAVRGVRALGVVAKATGIYMAVDTWNNTVMKEHEDALSQDQRKRFHLLIPMGAGKAEMLTDPTALSDFFEMVGAEGIGTSVAQLLRGQIGINDFVKMRADELWRAPLRRVVNVLSPATKVVPETFTGVSMFPDPFKPRPVEGNIVQRFMRSAGAGEFSSLEEFKQYMKDFSPIQASKGGTIFPPTYGPAPGITGIRDLDPSRSALADSYAITGRFLGDIGYEKGIGGGGPNTKTNRQFFNALLDEDTARADALLSKIQGKSFAAYLDARDPMKQVPNAKRREFWENLSPIERQQILRAQGVLVTIRNRWRERVARR